MRDFRAVERIDIVRNNPYECVCFGAHFQTSAVDIEHICVARHQRDGGLANEVCMLGKACLQLTRGEMKAAHQLFDHC